MSYHECLVVQHRAGYHDDSLSSLSSFNTSRGYALCLLHPLLRAKSQYPWHRALMSECFSNQELESSFWLVASASFAPVEIWTNTCVYVMLIGQQMPSELTGDGQQLQSGSDQPGWPGWPGMRPASHQAVASVLHHCCITAASLLHPRDSPARVMCALHASQTWPAGQPLLLLERQFRCWATSQSSGAR